MPDLTPTLTLANGKTIHYQIRPSKRAKYLRMQLSPDNSLIVTQPQGICEHQLAAWVNSKRDWVSKHLGGMNQSPAIPGTDTLILPDIIELPAINETLQVTYQSRPGSQIATDFTPQGQLILSGNTRHPGFCAYVLQEWLKGYAKVQLGEQLANTAQATGMHYKSYRVKGQKTRWGSCSSRGNINLNYKLLLLPPAWMHYTLVHELCHTIEMNHSKRFWALLEQQIPDYKMIHTAMRDAMHHLPGWVNYQLPR